MMSSSGLLEFERKPESCNGRRVDAKILSSATLLSTSDLLMQRRHLCGRYGKLKMDSKSEAR